MADATMGRAYNFRYPDIGAKARARARRALELQSGGTTPEPHVPDNKDSRRGRRAVRLNEAVRGRASFEE